jgi:hypothetical protein
MAFKLHEGKVKTIWMPITANTAIAKGALVTKTSSPATGLLVAATSSTPAAGICGVLNKAVAATDDDYAVSARLVPVLVPTERNVLWEFTVASGLDITDCEDDFDLTDSVTVNLSASTYDIVRPVKVISATKGIGLVKIFGSY